jgi:cytosine/adenosine deaminase-related metal-dependent hydrolase
VIWQQAVSIVNARVVVPGSDLAASDSVRFTTRVLGIGERPRPGDAVVDADGAWVLPGLVNAHDHLELNHYGRLKFRDRYCNVSEWIGDMTPRLAADPGIRVARSRPLADRLFIGALKNVLSGVTTVAHHNPFYRELRRGMPAHVVRKYGWAHSFFLARRPAGARGEAGGDIQERFRSTAAGVPFFVHLGEGVDADAWAELPRLEAIGCLQATTVLVHGVAIDREGWRRVARAGAGVVWCPASNEFLFGRTIDPAGRGQGWSTLRMAIGTDSRLTGSADLLDELRAARKTSPLPPSELLAMVTTRAADLLRQPRAGRIVVGGPADLVVIPPLADAAGDSLLRTERQDVRLVVVGGRPLVSDEPLAAVFGTRRATPRVAYVDSHRKRMDPALAARIAACPIAEPGVLVE